MKNQVNNSLGTILSICAMIAAILTFIILLLGENILQSLQVIYPSWAFPAYFIPWFLLLISSIQKLNKHKKQLGLQVWFLKISIPLFLFTLPYFSHFLTADVSSNCTIDCQINSDTLFGFEPYCMIFAMLSLFLLFAFPSKRLHNK
jgi:hypothetical protein